jgi:uncharacterized membrane protein
LKIRIRNELLAVDLIVLLLIAVVTFFPSNVMRIIFGFPLSLFFPGYTLMAAVFPRKESITGTERVVLSFGLSIAVIPIILLLLNYSPWGLRVESILYSVASFVFIMSFVAWFRRKRLPKEESFDIRFQLSLPSWATSNWDKALSIFLALTILGALGMVGYVIATPKAEESFTEFYLLGQEGVEGSYARQLVVGEEGRVVVGIANNEHKIMDYRVEVRIDGVKNGEVKEITLGHQEKWENEVIFMPEVIGSNQKVEFLLYKNGEFEQYLGPLQLWLDVTGK